MLVWCSNLSFSLSKSPIFKDALVAMPLNDETKNGQGTGTHAGNGALNKI